MREFLASIMSVLTSAAIFFQCLFGIGGLRIGNVVLKLEKDSYPVATETIKAELYNCTREPVFVAPYAYTLERRETDKWVAVPLKASVEIPYANYFLSSLNHARKQFHLTDHENVVVGKYRITASDSVYAEFELV